MSEASSSDPLDVAAALFARWRERRGAPGGRVPASLRTIACQLLELAPLELVAEACAVTPLTLRRWRERHTGPDGLDSERRGTLGSPRSDEPMASAFVALPPPSATAAPPPSDGRTVLSPTLTIERPDGLRVHLHGALDTATLTLLLDAGAGR